MEESSGCNDVLYYKKLLFWECIQLMGRPKKETVYNSLGQREYVEYKICMPEQKY